MGVFLAVEAIKEFLVRFPRFQGKKCARDQTSVPNSPPKCSHGRFYRTGSGKKVYPSFFSLSVQEIRP
jgi:hypothetical protein